MMWQSCTNSYRKKFVSCLVNTNLASNAKTWFVIPVRSCHWKIDATKSLNVWDLTFRRCTQLKRSQSVRSLSCKTLGMMWLFLFWCCCWCCCAVADVVIDDLDVAFAILDGTIYMLVLLAILLKLILLCVFTDADVVVYLALKKADRPCNETCLYK